MKIPRDESGPSLVKRRAILGYEVTRQTGSHIRLTTNQSGIHHITIPDHSTLKIGTINSILHEIADHFKISKEDLIKKLWEK